LLNIDWSWPAEAISRTQSEALTPDGISPGWGFAEAKRRGGHVTFLTFAYVEYAKVRLMAIFLVGENIDKARGHYRAQTGKLIQLMRGVYVDAGDDIDAMVMKHAVRIARYLYPQAYLSAASAVLLGPTRDGRLFISGRRIQRTRLRALEIVQNKAPDHPAVAPATVDDGMGEFTVSVSAPRQRFLEAFRTRSEHAASLGEDMRDAIARRLTEEYGGARAAADAAWALARENQWYREGEQAERFLLRRPSAAPARNEVTHFGAGCPLGADRPNMVGGEADGGVTTGRSISTDKSDRSTPILTVPLKVNRPNIAFAVPIPPRNKSPDPR
jgi:hypothetical protein